MLTEPRDAGAYSLLDRRAIGIIVTQVSRVGEGRAIRGQLQLVDDKFVTTMLPAGEAAPKLPLIGEVPLDGAVREAVQKRQLLLEALPGAPAARAIEFVAARLAP